MKKAVIVFAPFVLVLAFVFAVTAAFGKTSSYPTFPNTGRFENLKWGASEAEVRADLAKRGVKVSGSVEIHPHDSDGVRFQEPEPRNVYGATTDMGVLYAFINNHLVVVTMGFSTTPENLLEIIRQLKSTYELVDANSPNDSLVITDFRSDTGHVIVFMALDPENKRVNIQIIFMAEQEYKQTIGKKREEQKKVKPSPETSTPDVQL